MKKLLWVGDAACPSGFAVSTHNILETLRHEYDVWVLGLNYLGDPEPWPWPEWLRGRVFPCWPGGDLLGANRLLSICDMIHPDVIVIQNDPWHLRRYFGRIEELKTPPPVVGFLAVDGKNFAYVEETNKLKRAIFWTDFARDEALLAGVSVATGVVTLGVDLDLFYPGDKTEARRALGLPEDVVNGFIIGNVNRNQPRKRLDLTVAAFADAYHALRKDDAELANKMFLYLHVAPTGDDGVQLEQLAAYFKINNRTVLAEPPVFKGASVDQLRKTYQAFDVGISTSTGEGMGLTALEMMACGVPMILPDNSAFGEWALGAAFLVSCNSATLTTKVNVIGAVPSHEDLVFGIMKMVTNSAMRRRVADNCLRRAREDRFRWTNIAQRFSRELELALDGCSCADYEEHARSDAA